MIDTLLSCQTVEHGMAATTCRLLHLPLSPLYQTSLDKCCILKKAVYACCAQVELKKQYSVMCVIFLRTVKFNCSVSAHVLIRDVERLAANKLSQNLTSSKRLYRFKVFLDSRWTHLSTVIALEVRQRKITYSVFLLC